MTESNARPDDTCWLRRNGESSLPRDDAMKNVADATRDLIDRLHATEAPNEMLEGLATAIGGLAQLLAGHPSRRAYDSFAEAATAGRTTAHFAYSPVIGPANPLAPPVRVDIDDGVVRGLVTFGNAYEGPPGRVHGGYVAAVFDDVLGMAVASLGSPAFTGTLTVRYRVPTPLHTELRMVGEVDQIEGRKILTTGRMYAGDRLTAEAEAVFVTIDSDRLVSLARERSERG